MEGEEEEELTLDLDYITVEWDASISFAPLVHVVTSGVVGLYTTLCIAYRGPDASCVEMEKRKRTWGDDLICNCWACPSHPQYGASSPFEIEGRPRVSDLFSVVPLYYTHRLDILYSISVARLGPIVCPAAATDKPISPTPRPCIKYTRIGQK
jgi:hypothetical protein